MKTETTNIVSKAEPPKVIGFRPDEKTSEVFLKLVDELQAEKSELAERAFKLGLRQAVSQMKDEIAIQARAAPPSSQIELWT